MNGPIPEPTDISFWDTSPALRELLERKLSPREFAWEEFHKRYAPIIAGFAHRLGARPQDLDDIVQDVLLGFFSTSPTFVYDPAKGRFRGYLKVCTFHEIKHKLSNRGQIRTKSLHDVDPAALEVEQAWDGPWEHQVLKEALAAARA